MKKIRGSNNRMVKITHISDTHGSHSELKFNGGDILIHSGDVFDLKGKLTEQDVSQWFKSLPYTYKILVPGNHDQKTQNMKGDENFFILNNDVCEILSLKIYGLSVCLKEVIVKNTHNVFNDVDIEKMTKDDEVDILVTHGPPKGIFDIKNGQSVGSLALKKYVENKKPKYHFFGHAHHLTGIYSNRQTIFINNSIVYNARLGNVVNKPIDIMIDND
jgi:Icc-related predicted phosphoesterase